MARHIPMARQQCIVQSTGKGIIILYYIYHLYFYNPMSYDGARVSEVSGRPMLVIGRGLSVGA